MNLGPAVCLRFAKTHETPAAGLAQSAGSVYGGAPSGSNSGRHFALKCVIVSGTRSTSSNEATVLMEW